MSDEKLLHELRNSKGWPTLGNAAADRIEELEAKLVKAVDMLRILQVHPVVLAELNYDERSEKKGQDDE